MKRRLLIAGLVLVMVVVVVATVVVTGAIPMGTVILCLDQETYRHDETVTLTIRSLRTGSVRFGYPFEVQRLEDGDWVDVPLDVYFKRVDLVLLPGQSYEQSFVPGQYLLDAPTSGRYRMVREVTVGPVWRGVPRETRTLAAEFRIEG